MKGRKMKTMLVMACLFVMIVPITQAVDFNKTTRQADRSGFHWGRVLEAHCDARYAPNPNGSYGIVTERYFVLGFGRHTISIVFDDNILWQEGSWNNNTIGTGDTISLFKPMARKTFQFSTSGFGEFIYGISKITLSVDGVVMDEEYCFYPLP